MTNYIKTIQIIFMSILFLNLASCASLNVAPPTPNEVRAPQPIEDNSGAFLSPFTSDGVTAMWIDKAKNAATGAAIGSATGAYLGSKLAEQIPIFGSWLGSTIGDSAGREIAISASGGWDYIKETSDLSFNSLQDLTVWMYATHSSSKHYQEVLNATMSIYPDLKKEYYSYIQDAPRK